jgi:hypothetical protein
MKQFHKSVVLFYAFFSFLFISSCSIEDVKLFLPTIGVFNVPFKLMGSLPFQLTAPDQFNILSSAT